MDHTLIALLTATEEEPWAEWYHGTRLILADLMEERQEPGAGRVRDERPDGLLLFDFGEVDLYAVSLDSRVPQQVTVAICRDRSGSGTPNWADVLCMMSSAGGNVFMFQQSLRQVRQIRIAIPSQSVDLDVALQMRLLEEPDRPDYWSRHTMHVAAAQESCRQRVLGHFMGLTLAPPADAADPDA